MNSETFKARKECQPSFWTFVSKLFNEEDSYTIACFDQQPAESYFSEVYDSSPRSYTRPRWLPQPPPVIIPFNKNPISKSEVEEIIMRSRSSSSPSFLDHISYNILKHCPSLLPALLDLYNSCWKTGSVPQAWRGGVIHLIPHLERRRNLSHPQAWRDGVIHLFPRLEEME